MVNIVNADAKTVFVTSYKQYFYVQYYFLYFPWFISSISTMEIFVSVKFGIESSG